MRDEVLRHLLELRRRYRWVRSVDGFLELAFVLCAGVAAMLLIDRLAFELGLARPHVTGPAAIAVAFGAALGLALIAGVAGGMGRRVTPAAIAWRADRTLSLDERFLTSVELAAEDGGSRFAPAVFAQAAEVLRGLDVRRVFPPSPVGYRWGVLLALAAGAVLAAFAPRVEAPPVVDFAFSPERGPAPLTVAFENLSQGRLSRWDWDFGDGKGSSEFDPTHRFEKPGVFSVKLVVRGPGGRAEKRAAVEVIDPTLPVAEFDADPSRGRAPLTARFTNRSHRAETSRWNFGDGGTSAERNPVHTFEQPGLYDVVLEARNAAGAGSRTKRVKVVGADAPLADFRAMPRKGPAPLIVDFEDNSTGRITEWEWDVGDALAGTERVRRERMPSHVYRLPGRYTVRLKVKGPGGEDELTRVRYIEVEDEGGGGGTGLGGGGRGSAGGGGAGPGGRGGGPGTEEGKLFGDEARRPDAQFRPEAVTGQPLPGELVPKVKNVFGKGGPGERGQDRPYDSETFGEYQRAAEEAMNREHIPLSMRSYVKKYFEEIRPK